MRRQILTGSMLVFCFVVVSKSTTAQIDEHKMEAGAVFTSITLTDFKERTIPTLSITGDSTVKGLGVRFAYNINENFAVDAEGNFFPEAHFGNEEFGQKMQGFIGLKAGVRNKWVGVFAKARPGVMWFGDFSSRGSCTGLNFGSSCTVSHEKDFAMDVGGVFEFYPAERLIVRADIGDTIIRYPMRTFGQFNNPSVLNAETKNNLQISLGVGWRF